MIDHPTTERMRRQSKGVARAAVITVTLGYLGLLLIAPMVALVLAVADAPADVWAGITSPDALRALGLTLLLAVLSLALNGVLGIVGGLVLARQTFRGRRLLDALVDLPLAVSPVMVGLAFLTLVGRGGWLEAPLNALGVKFLFAFPGLLVATLFVTLPFTTREVALVLRDLGISEEEAAATLGAGPWTTFWRVTLPNLRHALEVSATLTTARALGEFGAVLVLGGAIAGRTQTATTFIHAAMEERLEPAAYGMSLILAAAAMVLLGVLTHRKHRGA